MSIPEPRPWYLNVFLASAILGIGGWMLILALLGYWYLAPVSLPRVTEPIPVLNENNEVAVGETIILQFDVVKTEERRSAQQQRSISCKGGNLVTLTAPDIELPVGAYTVIGDSLVLPAKFRDGEVCTLTFTLYYDINPVRVESVTYTTEQFTVRVPE